MMCSECGELYSCLLSDCPRCKRHDEQLTKAYKKDSAMIDPTKRYRTRDGREVRIYTCEGGGKCPIHGAVLGLDQSWEIRSWCANGQYLTTDDGHACDLIEVRPRIKRTVWVNLYQEDHRTSAYSSELSAERNQSDDRLACVKIEIDCEEGEGL